MIYRYRMLSEVNEDFLREYELKSGSSFLDFHKLIQDTVKFQGNELASFYICDSEWNRRTEITLLDMDEGEDNDQQDILLMSGTKLKEFMEEPRQRVIYEYDFLNPKTFYIELKGILKDDPKIDYPHCSFSTGEAEPPKPPEEDLEEEDLNEIGIKEIDKLLRDLGAGSDEEDDFESGK